MTKLSRRHVRKDKLRDYVLPDTGLATYQHGLGTLHVDGELRGYLASVVGEMSIPNHQPWLWFVVVWRDGTKEFPFEDYGPKWPTIRELDAGYLDHFEPSTTTEGRFLGFRSVQSRPGPPCRYEFAWLPAAEAATKWQQLGLVEEDF
jgi:hypothetical protein